MSVTSNKWASGFVLLLCCLASTLSAGDWPQPLGPSRNGVADPSEKIASRWPTKLISPWSRNVGSGYGGVVVASGRLILFHRIDSEEIIECLDAATGKPIWKQSHPTSFRPQVGSGDGPLCTPSISQGAVITFGAEGILSCHDFQTGEERWTRDTLKDFGANTGYFGCGSSPIVVGNRVLVNVGGKRAGAGIVAFDLDSGKTVWQKVADDASYSTPAVIELEGLPIAIVVTRLKCVGIEIPNGGQIFEVPFGARGPTVNGATPVILDNRIFLTSSYGVGSLSGRLEFPKFNLDYSGEEFFASQYATPIAVDGLLYGIDGREDVPPADLKCIDPVKKAVLWSENSFGYGTQILIDGKLLLAKTNGELILCQPSPEGYNELGRTEVLPGTVRALPAFSNGFLYVRDEATLKCVDLRK
jgi:outer membrane protein assembly factor BamB